MKKVVLVDGNNLLFRSYYATAYNGNLMKNSKGEPTNALFGFVNMMNKILNEEDPQYVLVAFDRGKNFRHKLYDGYKDGRIETPGDLLHQFPRAKEILDALGIKHMDVEDYEADDIIGTYARLINESDDYEGLIVSSDKDLLQLITDKVVVKLLKTKDYIMMDEATFKEIYYVDPINMIDIKALQGDKSDNIPGVKGIGEKGALSLLKKYTTIENLYEHVDEVGGKTKEKLILDKDNAFFSKQLATIYVDVPVDLTLEEIKKQEVNYDKLIDIYKDLEFYSFLKNTSVKQNIINKKNEYVISNDLSLVKDGFAFYIELDNPNYHKANFISASIYDGENMFYLTYEDIINNKELFKKAKITYDLKKAIVFFKDIDFKNVTFDTFISAYLLNYNVKDDIAYLSNIDNYSIDFYTNIVTKYKENDLDFVKKNVCEKSKYLYESYEKYKTEIEKENITKLFYEIEMPLVFVLADMEITGIKVDKNIILNQKEELKAKIDDVTKKIYEYAGEEFNINSPSQLSYILFEKLNLPHGKKKGRNGYSTKHEKLIKLVGIHPIIELILEYRNLVKILSSYTDSLIKYISDDGKIHTIYKQCLTRTGRLSSAEPNLQNIPIRNEDGKKIRKAFIADDDEYIFSSDYSQIELRILAHISNCEELKEAFFAGEDIHSIVASDIFGVELHNVTPSMRRTAKAVIFGIVYGISGFGLGENLDLPVKEASKYIDKYLTLYPNVKTYMDDISQFAKDNGYVTTIMNRKRQIEEINNTNYLIRNMGKRMAFNTPIQGSASDIIKKAMVEIYQKLNDGNYKSKLIIQVHDELVLLVKKDEFESVKKIVMDTMVNAFKLDVPLKVDENYGSNWYDLK